jgi:hypothetical protein
MTGVGPTYSLPNSGLPLCVACRGCGHRAAVPPEVVGAARGDMKELRELKLKCSLCLAKDYEAFVMVTDAQVQSFVDGAPLESFRRTNTSWPEF